MASNINMDDVVGIGITFQDENGNLIAKQSKTKNNSSKTIFQSYNSMALRTNEKIEDIYNSIFENNKMDNEQIAKVLDEPITKANEKSRWLAIAKANLIDKGIVFEELSRKTKNRELFFSIL